MWEMLEVLGVDNVEPAELEEVMEEALTFHHLHLPALSKPPPAPPKDPNRARRMGTTLKGNPSDTESPYAPFASTRRLMPATSHRQLIPAARQPLMSQAEQTQEEEEALRIPLHALLAGSPRLLQMISTINVDKDLCSLLGSRLGQHLSEAELHQLLPCSKGKFEEGETVFSDATSPARDRHLGSLFVLISGECSIVPADKDAHLLVGETLREGDVFGAYAMLCKSRKPAGFEVKALCSVEVLQI